MTAHERALLTSLQASSAHIDWNLLLLLARAEAAQTWPDEMSPDGGHAVDQSGMSRRFVTTVRDAL